MINKYNELTQYVPKRYWENDEIQKLIYEKLSERLNWLEGIFEEIVNNAYIKDMDIDSEAIRIFDIYKALSKIDGILDISDIKLNNGTSTIKLNDEIPVLGTLTVTEETV